MTLQQIESAIVEDETLQAVCHSLQKDRWCSANKNIDRIMYETLRDGRTELFLVSGVLLKVKKIALLEQLHKQAVDSAHSGQHRIIKTRQLLQEKVGFETCSQL